MADLIDRLTHDSESMSPPRPGIYVHAFTSDTLLYLAGKRSTQEMIQMYDLQGAELTQANQIRATIDGKNTTGKLIYANVVLSVFLLLSHPPDSTYPTPSVYFNADGSVIKSRVFGDLEIAG